MDNKKRIELLERKVRVLENHLRKHIKRFYAHNEPIVVPEWMKNS